MIRSVSFARGLTLVAVCTLAACAVAETRPAQGSGGGGEGKPVITRFSAAPSTLPAGGGTVTLSWQVAEADGIAIDHGVGTVTGTSTTVAVAATTVFTLTATNAQGSSTASTSVVVGGGGSGTGRYVAMVAPVAGEAFVAPATLRLIAAAFDPNNWPNNNKRNAASVTFYVDTTAVLTVTDPESEFWIFKGYVSGIAAGTHSVWARATYGTSPAGSLDSAPVTITVEPPPGYAQTVDLTANLALAGATSWVGAPGARIRVNGNGFRITGAGSAAITWKYVDFFDVGNRTSTEQPGIDLTTSGGIDVEGCTFDTSNTVRFSLGGSATATVRGNTFRSNMRQPLGQYPDGAQGAGPGSFPVAVFAGASTGAKTFAANNVGAGWVQLNGSAQNWVVGGDTPADGNVLIGPRVGIYADGSTRNVQIRRNYSHHIYYGGWSQGSNFELGGVASLTAEHNVVAGSSWPVRGVGGEFRYNLVLDAGHQWLWTDSSNGHVHHNVFVGGEADVGGLYALYATSGVRIENNTIDGMSRSTVVAALKQTAGSTSVTSNIFLNVPASPVSISGGTMTADYNLFWNSASPSYSDGRTPTHDVHADPRLASPSSRIYDFDETALWRRTLSARDVLQQYRGKYTPAAGSPAVDAGDPAGGTGNDIGAIGAGASNPADQFGN